MIEGLSHGALCVSLQDFEFRRIPDLVDALTILVTERQVYGVSIEQGGKEFSS